MVSGPTPLDDPTPPRRRRRDLRRLLAASRPWIAERAPWSRPKNLSRSLRRRGIDVGTAELRAWLADNGIDCGAALRRRDRAILQARRAGADLDALTLDFALDLAQIVNALRRAITRDGRH